MEEVARQGVLKGSSDKMSRIAIEYDRVSEALQKELQREFTAT